MPSLATFNANNFFLRYRFTRTYEGDTSRDSLIEAGEVGLAGYLPGLAFGQYTNKFIVWDAQRRHLAARALREPDGQLPDILCFQEVENISHKKRLAQAQKVAEYVDARFSGHHYLGPLSSEGVVLG